MPIWRAHSHPVMAMADLKRVSGGLGGADDGAPRARPDAGQALEPARPDSDGAPGLSECGGKPSRGQAIEDYDVMADLRMLVAGKCDDACEARLDAWIRDGDQAQVRELARAVIHEQVHELADEMARGADDDIINTLVRAYCLPPVPDSP